jgi:hypothetical protein
MTLCRAAWLLAAVLVIPISVAEAQFGGSPGTPGGDGKPDTGIPSGDFGNPATPSPACQQLMTLRSETQKGAETINAAGKRKAPPAETCKLFEAFLASEDRMITAVDDNGQRCGLPPDVSKQIRARHAKAQQIAKQICNVSARGGLQPGATHYD